MVKIYPYISTDDGVSVQLRLTKRELQRVVGVLQSQPRWFTGDFTEFMVTTRAVRSKLLGGAEGINSTGLQDYIASVQPTVLNEILGLTGTRNQNPVLLTQGHAYPLLWMALNDILTLPQEVDNNTIDSLIVIAYNSLTGEIYSYDFTQGLSEPRVSSTKGADVVSSDSDSVDNYVSDMVETANMITDITTGKYQFVDEQGTEIKQSLTGDEVFDGILAEVAEDGEDAVSTDLSEVTFVPRSVAEAEEIAKRHSQLNSSEVEAEFRKHLSRVNANRDVYSDKDNLEEEDADLLSEANTQGILPYQYLENGDMVLNAEGAVLKQALKPMFLENKSAVLDLEDIWSYYEENKDVINTKPFLDIYSAVLVALVTKYADEGGRKTFTYDLSNLLYSALTEGLTNHNYDIDLDANIANPTGLVNYSEVIEECKEALVYQTARNINVIAYVTNWLLESDIFGAGNRIPRLSSNIQRLTFAKIVASV